jgi:phage-related protein
LISTRYSSDVTLCLLVVLFNGFQKKTQKTPPNEIERAERLMKEYFDSKTEKNEKRE